MKTANRYMWFVAFAAAGEILWLLHQRSKENACYNDAYRLELARRIQAGERPASARAMASAFAKGVCKSRYG